MSMLQRALDALFPFRIVARNTATIDKLAEDKRKAFHMKIAAGDRLRTAVRREMVGVCTDENNIRALSGFSRP